MKHLNIVAGIMMVGVFVSCKKFDSFQENPNNPTTADPSLLLANLEMNSFSTIATDAALASRQLVYTQSSSNAQYYGWQRSGMSYSNISQAVKMEQEAARVGKTNYRYLGKFFKSYYTILMSQTFGDIPYSQMMQSLTNNKFDSTATRPVYDKQQEVYLNVLNELKVASDSLSGSSVAITGDIIYGGNIDKWKRLINSFTLRVLMSLSKKESNTTLNIKQRFNEIVSDPAKYPLLASNSENGQLTD